MTQVPTKREKRALRDALALWGTGILVAVLGVGYFLVGHDLRISKKLLLYVAFNAAFCLLVVWRFRGWFRHKGLRFLLPAWLVAHLLIYGLLAYADFSFLFYVLLFPLEVSVMRWIEFRRAAIRRERELKHRSQDAS